MIYHIVHIEPLHQNYQKAIEKVLKSQLVNISDYVEGILDIKIGNNTTDKIGISNYVIIMIFNTRRDLENWMEHPNHIPIKKILQEKSIMKVFDYNDL
ncbi:Dabb family protein [Listeria booriae]|uniref:Dabb family protein n=1 Tax=Listeria booriae TaxID=1552123 RepID=UPI001625331A|nr:Dabb family protein [Listeria booriae]MBC1513579.1 hypothetical protein [Listeria booriae]MBC6152548.1 hypothetical protein [Listeria booriae]MBC6306855.1 hypothetical protein [Listeria booriae]